ncbi:hypothetical protein ADN00_18915 [Ornatilinea apprima]|uniref:Uncharacterized protein n=1 Tax=Ornatilinea apprima TaxID=1134406 RepID=A0A0P6WVY2_9CHLR|nr:head-tail adaptor protein [Ornatilinea apprima]KPL70115.1 hypothetical protein ADN00_18915 [Ornatilinea apprima]
MLTEEELSQIQIDINASFPETCEIYHQVFISDGAGGKKSDWAITVTTGGRIGPVGRDPVERVLAEKVSNSQPYVITMPAGTVVSETDQIHIGERIFEVVGVIQRSLETARRVICKEVR